MTQQLINIGQSPNDNTGDTIRDAFNFTNNNFTELYTNVATTQTDITTVQTDITTAQSNITTLEAAVDKIETRPENLVFASNFGVVGDGVTDDTLAIQAALDHAGSLLDTNQNLGISGTSQVRLSGGTFLISSQLIVRNGTTLIGETKNPPYPNRVSGFKSNNNLLTGTEIICSSTFSDENAILLEPDNTGVEDLILDGHSINAGTTYAQVQVKTVGNKYHTARIMKLNINDDADPRINSFKFDNVEIPFFRVNANMEYQLQGIGGDGNYTFSITSGSLPNGLSMDTSGLITGTATALERTFPVFQIQDGSGNSFSRVFTVGTIIDEIKTRNINPSTVGASSTFQMETRWNSSDISWDILSDNLPSWVSIDSTGLLSFADTTTNDDAGFYEFKIRLLNLAGTEVLNIRNYKHEVRFDNGSIRIFGEQNLNPQLSEVFSYTYLANGGFGDYTWSINTTRSNAESSNFSTVSATEPFPGLTLNTATGEVFGTVTSLGSNIYYLRATSNTDNSIFFEARHLIDTRTAGVVPTQVSRSFPTGQIGQPYSFQFNYDADPSDPIETWTLINAPTGLSIDSNGLITGTPVGANYTNGVRIQWSCSVRNLAIRGFNSGSGVFSEGASNIHRIHRTMISVCDRGIGFNNQTFDSHFSDLYIYNCRVGMDLGPGAAGLTTTDSRIEFIHEDGVKMKTANENDFSNIYFDTCGWSSIRAIDSVNAIFVGCRSFRPGRLIRGVSVQTDSLSNKDFSNHVYLENSHRFTFTGNSFDLGSDDGGDGIFLTDRVSDNLRPYIGFRLYNAKELTVVGNNLTGCVENAFDANLTTFGENSFKGYRISDNTQTDRYLIPIDIKTEKQTLYIPNQSFKSWQRDKDFSIPPGPNLNKFPIADYWAIIRGIDTTIDQTINVSRKDDGLIDFDKYYINIQKPLNTTTPPVNNFQTLILENSYSPNLKYTSNKGCVLSFWAKSPNLNRIQPRISQYADSPDNSFQSYQFTGGLTTLTNKWVRYSFYFQLENLEGITLGDNAILNLQFLFNNFDEDINIDFSGVQVDFNLQTPFAQKLRYDSLSEAIDYAKLKYQKSKDYDEYFASWVDNLRYDVNGANWEPSYNIAYSPTTVAGALRSTIHFDVPLPSHPGHPDANGGSLTNFKIINPQFILDQTNPNKYALNGSNTPISYIESASKTHVEFSARNSTALPAADETYAYHWLYTNYESDINPGGGYS